MHPRGHRPSGQPNPAQPQGDLRRPFCPKIRIPVYQSHHSLRSLKKKESATRSPGRRPPGWYHDVGLGCRVPAGARHPSSAFENWLKMTPNEPRVAGQPDWPDRHFGPLSACEVVPKPQPDYRTNPIPVVTFSSAPIESAVYLYGYVTAHPAASDTMRRSPE